MEPIELPSGNGPPSRDWVLGVQAKLLASSYSGADQLRKVLPGNLLAHIATIVFGLCKAEPTVLDVNPSPEQRVIVVGDTHGQLHDVCRMFETAGQPDVDRLYILNGDFVDRGSWGVETLTLYMCWKWALPKNVFMLRGNHECSFCTTYYGFKARSCKCCCIATLVYTRLLSTTMPRSYSGRLLFPPVHASCVIRTCVFAECNCQHPLALLLATFSHAVRLL